MKKVITENDLDIVKENKKLERQIDEAMKKKCFICNQEMYCIGDLVWYCKRCETLTSIQHIVAIKDNVKME